MVQIWKRALNSLVSHMHSIHCNHKVGLRADVSPDVVALLACVCLFYVYANKTVEWMAAVQIRVQWFWQTHSWHFIVRHESRPDEWILVDHEVKYGVIQEDQLVSVSAHISWCLDYSSMRQKEVTLFKPLQSDCVCCASASCIATHLYPSSPFDAVSDSIITILVFNVACCALCWGLAAAVLVLHFPRMYVEGKDPDQSNTSKYEFLQIEIKIILWQQWPWLIWREDKIQ